MSKDKSKLAEVAVSAETEEPRQPEKTDEIKVPTVNEVQAAVEAVKEEVEGQAEKEPEEVEPVDPEVKETEEEAPLEYTDNEKEAMNHGWVPEDKLKEGEDFFSADEFLRRGELMQVINKLKRKTDNYEKVISGQTDALKAQADKMKEIELKDVFDARKTAIESGDVEAVTAYDKQIEEAKKSANSANQEVVANFVQDNAHWFNEGTTKTKEMKAFAIQKEVEIGAKNKDLPFRLVLEEVKEAVEEEFSDFFRFLDGKVDPKTPVVEKPYVQSHTAVESGASVKTVRKQEIKYADLGREAKNLVRTVVTQGKAPAKTDEEKMQVRKELESYTKMLYESGAISVQ